MSELETKKPNDSALPKVSVVEKTRIIVAVLSELGAAKVEIWAHFNKDGQVKPVRIEVECDIKYPFEESELKVVGLADVEHDQIEAIACYAGHRISFDLIRKTDSKAWSIPDLSLIHI